MIRDACVKEGARRSALSVSDQELDQLISQAIVAGIENGPTEVQAANLNQGNAIATQTDVVALGVVPGQIDPKNEDALKLLAGLDGKILPRPAPRDATAVTAATLPRISISRITSSMRSISRCRRTASSR